ncbi:hypothetical protein ACHQM5_010352 [Ranunculus cassubicifolius]
MENLESFQLPRGGPIYLENLVGPLTRVTDFQSELDQELCSLEEEFTPSDDDDECDLSVDQLKILSEEELVDMALKQALQETEISSQVVRGEEISRNEEEGALVERDGECQRESPLQVDMTEVLEEENSTTGKETSRNRDALVEEDDEGPLRKNPKKSKRMTNLCNEEFDEQHAEGKLCNKSRKEGRNTIDKDKSAAELEKGGEPHMENTSQGKSTEEVEEGVGLFERHQTRSRTARSESHGKERSKKDLCEKDEQQENAKKRRRGRMSKSNGALVKYPEKRKKRGRYFDRDTRAGELENPIFIEKVEQLARIKQKQDEDKTAARLHSFNGAHKVNGAIISSPSENVGKMKSLRSTASSTKVRNSCNALQYTPITHSEVVLSVEVYNQKIKTQELLVLGNQNLSELRDQIYCSTDELMQKSGKHDPSGYFLIEQVFCNDKRDPSAIDYSQPILDWLRDSKNEAREKWECVLSGELQQKQRALFGESPTPPMPQFKAVEMHRIRFCDISFRLGAGYMYCHQGDCKHLIVIRDMRRVHPEDVQNRASYPVVTFQHKTRYRKCDACKIYRATKVTVDDKWARENPCHFCDNCYYLLHYGEDGSLLYHDFTVHDYHHG